MKSRWALLPATILVLLACRELRSPADPLPPAPRIAGPWRGLLSFLPRGNDAELVTLHLKQNGRYVYGDFSTLRLGDVMIEGQISGPDLNATATSFSPSGTYRGSARGPASPDQIELQLSINGSDSVLQLTR